MEKRYAYVLLLISLVLIFAAGPSASQDSSRADGSSINESQMPSASIARANAAPEAAVANNIGAAAQNLRYIWTITGIEKDPVTMALDQDGSDLFGRAKYEPDNGGPWNGNVAGLISGNEVHLVIAALKGDKQVSTVLDGTYTEGEITGEFFQTSGDEISGRGKFTAIWINPDLSSYTPAEIRDKKTEIQVQQTQETETVPPADVNQISPQKTRYHDVHQDADRVLTGVGDISQIPIGMGGSGLP